MKRRNVRTAKRQNGAQPKRPWLRRVGVMVGCLLAGAIVNVLAVVLLTVLIEVDDFPRFEYLAIPMADDTAFIQVLGSNSLGSSLIHIVAHSEIDMAYDQVDQASMLARAESMPGSPDWVALQATYNVILDRRVEIGGSDRWSYHRDYEARGWPVLAFYVETYDGIHGLYPPEALPDAVLRECPTWYVADAARSRIIPTLPIWRGVVINTAVYAIALWLLLFGLGAIRRRRSLRRGLCPSCGYDLRGADHRKCPECGEAVGA